MPPMCPSSPVKNLKPCQDLGSEELARTRGRPVFDFPSTCFQFSDVSVRSLHPCHGPRQINITGRFLWETVAG